MIEGIRELSHSDYTVSNQQTKININEKVTEFAHIDIQEILNQIKEYTYTDQDKKEVDNGILKSIKEQLGLKEEDVYELYKRGVDLEQLNIEEVTYRSALGKKIVDVEEDSVETENKENTIDKKESIEQKIEVIKKENDNMYLYALTNKNSITINSLYESNFKGNFKKGIGQYSKEEVDHVLGMNGLEQNSGNTWAANLLMMYDMGVSAQSVTKLQNMQSAITALEAQGSGSLSGDDELIKEGQVQYKSEYVDRITDELGMVTDEHIEKLIEEGKEININELRENIHKKASEALDGHEADAFYEQNGGAESDNDTLSEEIVNLTEQTEDIKKQIHQIRTKLTVEAAQKISAQMPIESSNLAEVASILQQMEQEEAIKALNVVQLPVTNENVETLTGVMAVTKEMSHYFMQTVQIEMDTDGQALLSEIKSALNAYGMNETPVERRFGETISKVQGQIKDLLESQNIEASQINIEAAKALITNQMEVSETNIESIQEVVIKLNTFLEEMTPIQAATLLKEGINPYEASIDELLSWMGTRKVEGLKNSVAETIVAMEETGQINEEQKEGMIGLYRILQGVSYQKEEVLGYLYKNNLPLTIENLQIAVQYAAGKKHIEVKVDDEFGELESLTYEKQRAKEMIENSIKRSIKTLESIKILENMELPITEESVNRITKMSALLYPYIKEQFKKDLGKFEGMSTLPDSFLEKLESVQNTNPEIVEQMIEQKVPLTLSNIYWMDKITRDPSLYGTLLDDKGLLKEGMPSDLDELGEMLNQIEDSVKKQKEEAALVGDLREYRDYKQIEEVVHFQRERIENEGLYQIPFIIDGERKLINLYLHKEDAGTVEVEDTHLKAVITYETKYLGEVKAYFELKGDVIGYKVEAETTSGTEALRSHSEVLLEKLKNIGYNVQYSEFEDILVEDELETQVKYKYEESSFEEII